MKKKDFKVQNTGNGVHAKFEIEDDVAEIEFEAKVRVKNKDDVPDVQAAWDETRVACEAECDFPSVFRAFDGVMAGHIQAMEQKIQAREGPGGGGHGPKER